MEEQEKTESKNQMIRQLEEMVSARVNDAVKLAYLSQEEMEMIDTLDLTALREFKRSSSGVVEMKFCDRMQALEQLIQLTQGDRQEEGKQILSALAAPSKGDAP